MILVDLNALLDVLQKREPHYPASAAVLDAIVQGTVAGAISAHAVTTIHYIVRRHQDRETSNRVIDWLLRFFRIAPVGQSELLRARALNGSDFEDAVVAAAAESARCEKIVTRNIKDFRDSPIPAVTPHEYLLNVLS